MVFVLRHRRLCLRLCRHLCYIFVFLPVAARGSRTLLCNRVSTVARVVTAKDLNLLDVLRSSAPLSLAFVAGCAAPVDCISMVARVVKIGRLGLLHLTLLTAPLSPLLLSRIHHSSTAPDTL